MKKKKILILSNIAWTISTFRRYLIEELVAQGYEVVCVADLDDFSETSVHIITSYGAQFIRIRTDRKGINPLKDLAYVFKLLTIFRREQPDLILNYTIKPVIYGTIAAKVAKTPSFAILTGLGSSFIKKGILSHITLLLYKVALAQSSKVFFLNETDKEVFLTKKLSSPRYSYVLPGEGIDTDEYSDCGYVADSKFRFMLIARLLKDKGIYEYIEAARLTKKHFPNTYFYLAGTFDEGNPSAVKPKEVDSWVNQGIINYLGKTDSIKEFFAYADAIVLPSYREGLSRLLLEAASCRKPIIATNVPGCKELVQNSVTGFLCEPENILSLAEAMEKMLLASPTERASFGTNGRNFITENFGKDRVNAIYLTAIKEAIG